MTSVQAPSKILFTGANGYFATYAIKDLLERGYTVVGTVRSTTKGEELVKLHDQHGDRFSYAIVPDIVQPGAFDEIIKGGKFDGVAHAASPVVGAANSPEDYIRPAVDGTVGILASIKQHGPTIKRVVVTSSALAALHNQEGVEHNESHYNEAAIKAVEEKGINAGQEAIYSASKTHAEKAAWKFMEDNKGKINFDLVTVLPSYILGAPIHAVASRDQLTSTNMALSEIRKPRPESEWAGIAFHFVHAKDIATLHSVSFSAAEASGHRVFGIAAQPTWQDIYDALNADPAFPSVPKGKPGVGNHPDSGSSGWDMTFTKSLLGKEFIGTKESFRETEEYYQKNGWSFV